MGICAVSFMLLDVKSQEIILTVNFIQKLFNAIAQIWQQWQMQRVVSAAFVAVLLLTTSVDTADLPASTKTMLNDMIARGEEGRPVTSGQWQAQNEALQGNPAEQLEQIAKQSADAIDEMADIYPNNAKALTPGVDQGKLPQDK